MEPICNDQVAYGPSLMGERLLIEILLMKGGKYSHVVESRGVERAIVRDTVWRCPLLA